MLYVSQPRKRGFSGVTWGPLPSIYMGLEKGTSQLVLADETGLYTTIRASDTNGYATSHRLTGISQVAIYWLLCVNE